MNAHSVVKYHLLLSIMAQITMSMSVSLQIVMGIRQWEGMMIKTYQDTDWEVIKISERKALEDKIARLTSRGIEDMHFEIERLEAIEVAAKYALRTYGLPSQIIAMDELSEALDSKEQTGKSIHDPGAFPPDSKELI